MHEQVQISFRPTQAGDINRECAACHNPHQAKLAGLLVAKSPDLCLTCHKDLKDRLEKDKAHPPAARDCTRCHKPHFSAQDSLMVQPVQAHLNIEVSVMRCQSCHDPHASKDPKFFKTAVHPPFASGGCEECHIQ